MSTPRPTRAARPQKVCWAALQPLIAAGVRASEGLPPAERADVFEGIALLAHAHDRELERQAQSLADSLRDAESLCLHFRHLYLSPAGGHEA